ncbi:MAG TPA: PPC domain-containing DNA-binding protein [Thermoleophilia bacterium]|nr:PPC domain-containing DNA-binding protein [Thermoleophilia bacterium]
MGDGEFTVGRTIVARLSHGADLLDEIVTLAARHGIEAAALLGLGALQRARLAFYDQTGKQYSEFGLDLPLEITSLTGNISRRDDRPASHVHLTLADHAGQAFGGHAAPGCIVFACELVITELRGPALERAYDEVTGLPLWRGF